MHSASYSLRRPRPITNTPFRIQRTHPRLGETNAGKKRASSVSGLPTPGPAEARERARDERIRRHEQQRPHCQSSSHAAALAIRTCCNLPASMWLQDSAGPGGNVDSKLTTDNASIGPIQGASSTLQYHHSIRCRPLPVRYAHPLPHALRRRGLETQGQPELNEIDTRSFWAKLLRCRLVPVRRSPFCLSHPHSLSQPNLASLRDSRFQ